MNNKNLKSFTLIEILVVIIIVAIMASFVFFNTDEALQKKQRLEVLTFSEGLNGKNLSSLVSEWKFDGPTSAGSLATNSDVKDTWGYNNGDVIDHAPTVREGEDCVSGKCLEFDGENDYVGLGNVVDNFTSVTVSLWIKSKDKTSRNLLNSNPLILHYRGAGFYLRDEAGGNSGYLNWSPYPEDNKWSHIIATWSNPVVGDGQMKLYINGKKQSTERSYAGGASGKLRSGFLNLGRYFNSSQVWFYGSIDEVRIYKKALSISEINESYVAGLDSMLETGAISKKEYNQRILNLAKNE